MIRSNINFISERNRSSKFSNLTLVYTVSNAMNGNLVTRGLVGSALVWEGAYLINLSITSECFNTVNMLQFNLLICVLEFFTNEKPKDTMN